MLQIWAKAWQRKDFATYFAHYTPEFAPSNATTHNECLAQRRARISRANNMTITADPVDIISQTSDRLTIHFMLNYRSGNYSDTTKKKMILAHI